MILLLYGCGLRTGELCQLDVGDVDLERQELVVRHGKGERQRRIPVPAAVWTMLLAYLAERKGRRGALLRTASRGVRLCAKGVCDIVHTAAELDKSPFREVLFEGFIASEIAKAQLNAGARLELYFFRDEQGLEVDFLVPGRGGTVRMVECKASKTIAPAMAGPMLRLAEALKKHRSANQEADLRLVHEEPRAGTTTRAVAPGVRAQPWQEFLTEG